MKPTIPIMYVVTNDHCNLNCSGCDGFSPLADKIFYTSSQIENDCLELSSKVHVKSIGIMGGEPLLHRDLDRIIEIVRTCFKKSKISLLTNGILLGANNDNVFEACHQYNVRIAISKYPLNLPLHRIKEMSSIFEVPIVFYKGGTAFDVSLSLKKVSNPQKALDFCRNDPQCFCAILRDGKLYHCSKSAFIHLYNKKFDLSFPVGEGSDIYNLTGEEIVERVWTPIKLCNYCHTKIRNLKWKQSEMCKEEWLYEGK